MSMTKPRAFRDSDDEVQIQSVVPVPAIKHMRTAPPLRNPGVTGSDVDRNVGLN